jgi:hypothetical protein
MIELAHDLFAIPAYALAHHALLLYLSGGPLIRMRLASGAIFRPVEALNP